MISPSHLILTTAAGLLLAFRTGTQAQDAVPATVIERGAGLPPAAQIAAEQVVVAGTPGITVIAGSRHGEALRVHVGEIGADTQYPIASASKWLVAAVVMTLVDDGLVTLDQPVSTWLPGIGGTAEQVTLRHLLAQTSGLAGGMAELYDLQQDHRMTLAQSAADVLQRAPSSAPGETFVYGGPGFQVVGAVVEAITGQSWEEAFQQRIGRPLGMTRTYWTHLVFNAAPPPVSETRNPVLQGGAVSTAGDYAAFLAMLANNGQHEGRQIISQASLETILTDQTAGATITPTGAAILPDAHYALGNWCETWDQTHRCTRSSSLGAFGTYPWLDVETGQFGLVFINRQQDTFAVWEETLAIQSALTAGH